MTTFCPLIGAMLGPHGLGMPAMEDRAFSIGAGCLGGGAEPLLFRPRTLRLGMMGAAAQLPKVDVVSTDDAPLQRGTISLSEGPHWNRVRWCSSLTVRPRLIHCANKTGCLLFLSFQRYIWREKQEMEPRGIS